ncbi:hypothetical protein B484DRAFT_429632, partial [Ochromonadaceae sp. CCMP2298]
MELFAWGSNRHGQLGAGVQGAQGQGMGQGGGSGSGSGSGGGGDGGGLHQQLPLLIPTTERVIGLSCGYAHSLVWTEAGTLLGCGSNKYGQLALSPPTMEVFTPIPLEHACIMAACGHYHSLAISNDSTNTPVVYGWGQNYNQQVTAVHPGSIFEIAPGTGMGMGADVGMGADAGMKTGTNGADIVLLLAAGGDQSLAIVRVRNGGRVGNGQSTLSASNRIGQAPTPVDAPQLISLLRRALREGRREELKREEKRARAREEIRAAAEEARKADVEAAWAREGLRLTSELFSCPSLLAASFSLKGQGMWWQEQGRQEGQGGGMGDQEGDSGRGEWLEQRRVQESVVVQAKEELRVSEAAPVGGDVGGGVNVTDADANGGVTDVREVAGETDVTDVTDASLPTNRYLSHAPLLDILGLENCYVSLFMLGEKATQRLLAAQTLALKILLRMYPPHIFAARLLSPLLAHFALNLRHAGDHITETKTLEPICRALGWLYDVNELAQFVPASAFYCAKINALPDHVLATDFLQWRAT